MKRHAPHAPLTFLALAAALLALPAGAQGREAATVPDVAAAAPAEPEVAYETVAGGEVRMVPIGERDAAVPRPVGQVAQVGVDGDVQTAAPSGDPFFLGFAAGPYYPPAGERIDPELLASLPARFQDGRPGGETYAFVMFGERISVERTDRLAAAGARVLEFHPHNCLKVALAPEAIDDVAALSFVRWIGLPRAWQKQHPLLAREMARTGGEPLEVFVNVYDSDFGPNATFEVIGSGEARGPLGVEQALGADRLPRRWRSGGWQERALEDRGLEVISYSDTVRAFRTRVVPGRLEEVVRLDFVQFVEPVFPSGFHHDESMPMTNADRNRSSHDGGTNNAAIVGIVDSGIDAGHLGLDHVFGIGWDMTSTTGAWIDNCGHGSHVAGTILGAPPSSLGGFTGAAPGLGWGPTGRLFNVKLWNFCATFNADVAALTSLLHTAQDDGSGNVTPRPHVINHSWGSVDVGPYFGTEADARELDWEVYQYGQQHIFSAGNLGSEGQTLTLQASAKNTLAVGNVNTYRNSISGYPGNAWVSSSRGPTADLRWGPQLCAPGVNIGSVNANTASGYVGKTGTSMAAPHVTGIASQLVDEHAFLRYRPAALSAVMMAGSITKDSTLLSTPSFASNHHLNIYGTGRIDAIKARGSNTQQSTYFWGFSQGATGFGQVSFPVHTGATQVTIVMHYKERGASAGASKALVNDLDLWIDAAPFASGGNSGDYFAHQSTRDNTEIRIINNPTVADWRLKVYPESVPGGSSSVGLCAIVAYGDVTPNTTLTLYESDRYLRPNEQVEVTAQLYNPSYFASAAYLEADTQGGPILAAEVTLADGIVTDLKGNEADGYKVLLGDVLGLSARSVRWRTRWASEGHKTFVVAASADNIEGGVDVEQETFVVDGTAPIGPTNLVSTTHVPGVVSCDGQISFTWAAGHDALSGIAGYRSLIDSSPDSVPTGAALDVSLNATSASASLALGTSYYHLRARDRSGNWGTTQHAGPFLYAPGLDSTYCVSAPNSAGQGARMSYAGSLSVQDNAFELLCQGLPANRPSMFFYAPNQTQLALGNGFLCVSGPTTRLRVISTGNGTAVYPLDFGDVPPQGQILAGSTWKFQNWYRDPTAGGAAFNLSNGLSITFCQ